MFRRGKDLTLSSRPGRGRDVLLARPAHPEGASTVRTHRSAAAAAPAELLAPLGMHGYRRLFAWFLFAGAVMIFGAAAFAQDSGAGALPGLFAIASAVIVFAVVRAVVQRGLRIRDGRLHLDWPGLTLWGGKLGRLSVPREEIVGFEWVPAAGRREAHYVVHVSRANTITRAAFPSAILAAEPAGVVAAVSRFASLSLEDD